MADLTARAAVATAAQQQELAQLAATQMTEIIERLNRQLNKHVTDFDKQCAAALSSTSASIATDLDTIRNTTGHASRRVRRSMIWPPITASLAAALILGAALLMGWHRTSGIPTTTITTPEGATMTVLTERGWTTCKWHGHTRPCRPTK